MKLRKTSIFFMLSLLLAPILGTILMIFVYNIPIQPIRDNIQESSQLIWNEGDQWNWAPGTTNFGTRLDGFF